MNTEVVAILVAVSAVVVTILMATFKLFNSFGQRLTRIETLVESAEKNTKPNGGGSPYDKMNRKIEELSGLLHWHIIETQSEKESLNA